MLILKPSIWRMGWLTSVSLVTNGCRQNGSVECAEFSSFSRAWPTSHSWAEAALDKKNGSPGEESRLMEMGMHMASLGSLKSGQEYNVLELE